MLNIHLIFKTRWPMTYMFLLYVVLVQVINENGAYACYDNSVILNSSCYNIWSGTRYINCLKWMIGAHEDGLCISFERVLFFLMLNPSPSQKNKASYLLPTIKVKALWIWCPTQLLLFVDPDTRVLENFNTRRWKISGGE